MNNFVSKKKRTHLHRKTTTKQNEFLRNSASANSREVNPSNYRRFCKRKNDVPKVLGKPSFTAAKQLLDAVETNPIAMTDRRDTRYGKLHLMEDTSLLPNGPALQVVQSADQGQPQPYVALTTVQEQQNYLHEYRRDKEY